MTALYIVRLFSTLQFESLKNTNKDRQMKQQKF